MEWIDRLNKAIDYIEQHLTEELNYEKIAQAACCSTYHFQRMFTCMSNIYLSEYIRRRRMSKAALELQSGDAKVIDISLKYGYTSPTSFNRAFQSIHGITPSAAKKKGAKLKTYPPICFCITLKGAEELNYRIEEKSAFRIVGIPHPLHRELEKNYSMIPQLWQNAAMDGTIAQFAEMIDGEPAGLLGVCVCNTTEPWQYWIGVSTSAPAWKSVEEYIIPSSTWAIFTGTGTQLSIRELEHRIMAEWMPASGYKYSEAPDIEVYLNPDPDHARYEVWVPIIKNKRRL